MKLDRRYIVDENNHKVAVQIDIEVFEQIENILEDYALYQFMQSAHDNEELSLEDAVGHYERLRQNQCN